MRPRYAFTARSRRHFAPVVEHRVRTEVGQTLYGDGNSRLIEVTGRDWERHCRDVALVLDRRPRRVTWFALGALGVIAAVLIDLKVWEARITWEGR